MSLVDTRAKDVAKIRSQSIAELSPVGGSWVAPKRHCTGCNFQIAK